MTILKSHLSLFLNYLSFDQNSIETNFLQKFNLSSYINLVDIIRSISKENNIQESVIVCLEIIESIGEKEFLKVFIHICQKSIIIPLKNIIDFLIHLQKSNQKIIDTLIKISKEIFFYRKDNYNKNLLFILHQLYHQSYITKEDLNFIFNQNHPFAFIDIFGKEFYKLDYYSLSKDEKRFIEIGNFALHQKSISEGHSQDPILQAIRDDNVALLQDLLIQAKNTINQNQKIQSEYERFFIFEDNKLSFIEYSALFGSIKCFNYFLTNESNYDIKRCMIYAIAGNSKDIISTLSQKIMLETSNEVETYIKVSIEYNQPHIFEWLFVSYYDQYNEDFLNVSFEHYNFYTLVFLLKYGFSLFDLFISSIYSNNTYFVKYSNELVKLSHKESHINHLRLYFKVYIFNS